MFRYSIKKQSNLPPIKSEKHIGNGIPLRGILGSTIPLLSCPPRLGAGNAFALHPHRHGIQFHACTTALLTTQPSPGGTRSTIYEININTMCVNIVLYWYVHYTFDLKHYIAIFLHKYSSCLAHMCCANKRSSGRLPIRHKPAILTGNWTQLI